MTQESSTINSMIEFGQIGDKRPYSRTQIEYGKADKKWREQSENIPNTANIGRTIENRNRSFGGDDEEEQNKRRMSPEQQSLMNEFHSDFFQEIITAESQPERKYFTYKALERIVDYSDDFNARMLREKLALTVIKGGDGLKSLRGEYLSGVDKTEKQKGLEQSLQMVEDVDKLFDSWFNQYRYLSMSTKIFQTAFSNIPEFMPPDFFARVYGELPGFKEGDKEWPSFSKQLDKDVRAYIYLALQSDPRWKNDLDYFRKGEGFKLLFENESTEKEWLYKIKLLTLPNEISSVAYLRGKAYERLTPTDKAELDKLPAFNRFADAANGGSMKHIKEMVEELSREGKNSNDPALIEQSRIAENFARQTFLMFGLGGMYGTRGTAFDKSGNAIEVAAEAGPWSDTSMEAMRPGDKNIYNDQSGYWTSSTTWQEFAPEHLMVDFLRMLSVKNSVDPQSKSLTRSAYELMVAGKTIGEVMKDADHITDWGYRAFLIRYLFVFKEDSGALPFMSGSLLDSKLDQMYQPKYWVDGQKSIHIVCRDWVVTKGYNEKYFTDNKPEIIKLMNQNQMELGDPVQFKKAEGMFLKEKIVRTKNRWKAIAYLGALEKIKANHSFVSTLKETINLIPGRQYLPKGLLNENVNFDDPKSIASFLDKAENWPLDGNLKFVK